MRRRRRLPSSMGLLPPAHLCCAGELLNIKDIWIFSRKASRISGYEESIKDISGYEERIKDIRICGKYQGYLRI